MASSVRQTHQLMINSKQLQAILRCRKSPSRKHKATTTAVCAGQCQPDWSRRAATRPRRRPSAQAQLDVAIQQYNANQAMFWGLNWKISQPCNRLPPKYVRLAGAGAYSYCQSDDRLCLRRAVQPGAQISPTTPLMAVVQPPICGWMPTLKRRRLPICVRSAGHYHHGYLRR